MFSQFSGVAGVKVWCWGVGGVSQESRIEGVSQMCRTFSQRIRKSVAWVSQRAKVSKSSLKGWTVFRISREVFSL